VRLILGLTGTARFVTKLITRPVVLGIIILGLGFGLMIEGAKLMAQDWWIGGAAFARHVLAADQSRCAGDVPAAAVRGRLRHLERSDPAGRLAASSSRAAGAHVCSEQRDVGIAFVVGLGAYWLNKKGLLRV
jgi:hypothetical protein